MQTIVFTHSYFLRFDPKQWRLGQPYAPLGTISAASLIRNNGYKVSLHDTMFSKSADSILEPLSQHQPEYLVIYDDGFNYLTKMCLTNMREAAFRMIHLARQKGCTVIISSSDSTDRYEQYLEEGADYILMGEAEYTLLDLLNALRSGADDFTAIKGIAYKKDTAYIKTEKRPVIRDLDSLPLPAWDLIDMQPYQQMWRKSTGYFSINMGTTRGCPFKCNWCAKPIYGNRYNARSPGHVVSELKWLREKYHFDHVWFCDDIFGLKPGWVNEFADLIQQENLRLKFKIQSRADLLVQEHYVDALSRAGCDNVWMGAESGSQKILDAMEKGITLRQIEEATVLLRKHSIKASFFIQFGYIGETREDIRKTVDMINHLLPDEIGISVSYPLPGTGFYEKVKASMKEKTNWTDSDELAIMFSNTYKPEFYKQLHRYVHKTYRKHVAMKNLHSLWRHPLRANYISLKKALSSIYYLPASLFEHLKLKKLQAHEQPAG